MGLGLHIRDLLGWQWFAMGAVALAADGLQWEVATLAGGCTDDEPADGPLCLRWPGIYVSVVGIGMAAVAARVWWFRPRRGKRGTVSSDRGIRD